MSSLGRLVLFLACVSFRAGCAALILRSISLSQYQSKPDESMNVPSKNMRTGTISMQYEVCLELGSVSFHLELLLSS